MTSGTARRWRLSPRMVVALLAGLMVALLISAAVSGASATAGKLEQAASLLTIVLVIASAAILILVAGRHVDLHADGNLVSLGRYGTAWVLPLQAAFFITVGAFWLAAVARQALSSSSGWPAGRPSAGCSASGPSPPARRSGRC